MKQSETFTKEITYKMKNGKIINTVKKFRNSNHFDNYYNKLVMAQCNILDITEPNNIIKQSETFTKEITYKMGDGKVIKTVKKFRNSHHFDNYYDKLVQAQCNVLDITEPNSD